MKSKNTPIALVILFLLFGKAYGQAPPFAWAHVFTGQEINAVATNPLNGDVYAAGHFGGTIVDFDPGPSTFNLDGYSNFIGKYDADGNLIWAKKSGGSNVQKLLFNHLDGSLYIMGNYQGLTDFDPDTGVFNLDATGPDNVFLSKLNGDGEFVWVKSLKAQVLTFNINPLTGDIFLTGGFQDSVDADPGVGMFKLYSQGFIDVFIIKLDNAGNFIWAKSIGGTYLDSGFSVDVDHSNGDVFVAGLFTTVVDFNPDPVEEFIMSGPNQWGYTFILKFDESGNFKWAKSFGGSGSSLSPKLKLDHTEKKRMYLAASFIGNYEVDPDPVEEHALSAIQWAGFLLELDSSANLNWVKLIKPNGEIFLNEMVINPRNNGGIYLGGEFLGLTDFDPGPETFNLLDLGIFDVFIARYDLSGNFIWAKSAGGEKLDYGESIALDSFGNVYVGGYFTSDSITFDNTTFLNSNPGQQFSYDMFIAKLGSSPVSVPEDLNPDQIHMYPNPATGELMIEINEVQLGIIVINVFNNIGEIVFTKTKQSRINQSIVDVNKLIPGIYFIQIQIGSGVLTKKFLKI